MQNRRIKNNTNNAVVPKRTQMRNTTQATRYANQYSMTTAPRPSRDQTVQANTRKVTLNYELPSVAYTNSGGSVIGELFKFNSTYDWLGSGFTPGIQYFNYIMSLDRRNVVESIDLTLNITNREQFAVDAYFFETVDNPLVSLGTVLGIQSMAATAACVWKYTLGEQYVQVTKFYKRIYPAKILGNNAEYYGSGDYACNSTSDPAKVIYGALFFLSSSPTLGNGLDVRLSARIHIKVYSITNVSTPLMVTTVELLIALHQTVKEQLLSATNEEKEVAVLCLSRKHVQKKLDMLEAMIKAFYESVLPLQKLLKV